MTLSTSHPSRATPTQMALHAEAIERRERLGIKAPRPVLRFKMTELRAKVQPREAMQFIREEGDSLTPREEARQVVAVIADEYGVRLDDIFGPRRQVTLVRARYEAIHAVISAFPMWSYPQVGRFFNRDHSTIIQALKVYRARVASGVWEARAQ